MRRILAVALLVSSFTGVQPLDEPNPFKNAKVGQWVEYKVTSANIDGKTKMTIVAKDDKEATYEVAGTLSSMGKKKTLPIQKLKIDLTKPYDPFSAANMKGACVKIEKVGEGKEKIKIGGKEFNTKWIKLKATVTVNNMNAVSEYKAWFSDDVPLSGMVKVETTTSMNMTK